MPAPALGRRPRILVLGYGNPGRRDDGLGPAFADRLDSLCLPGITVETACQLAIEHAHLAAQHDVVVFADAADDLRENRPFYLWRIHPEASATSFSHSLSPQSVLQLAAECFGARPRGWLLGIRAMDLESFGEGLSPEGEANLSAALAAFREAVECGRFDG
jgi:hydrogenase maturation protease